MNDPRKLYSSFRKITKKVINLFGGFFDGLEKLDNQQEQIIDSLLKTPKVEKLLNHWSLLNVILDEKAKEEITQEVIKFIEEIMIDKTNPEKYPESQFNSYNQLLGDLEKQIAFVILNNTDYDIRSQYLRQTEIITSLSIPQFLFNSKIYKKLDGGHYDSFENELATQKIIDIDGSKKTANEIIRSALGYSLETNKDIDIRKINFKNLLSEEMTQKLAEIAKQFKIPPK